MCNNPRIKYYLQKVIQLSRKMSTNNSYIIKSIGKKLRVSAMDDGRSIRFYLMFLCCYFINIIAFLVLELRYYTLKTTVRYLKFVFYWEYIFYTYLSLLLSFSLTIFLSLSLSLSLSITFPLSLPLSFFLNHSHFFSLSFYSTSLFSLSLSLSFPLSP